MSHAHTHTNSNHYTQLVSETDSDALTRRMAIGAYARVGRGQEIIAEQTAAGCPHASGHSR